MARKRKILDAPVLVIDELGFTQRIRSAGSERLAELAEGVDRQFRSFRAKVPHRAVMVGRRFVLGTPEFVTLRFNDMFVLHAGRPMRDASLRFLISGSLLFQSMLLAGQIPRGGLGFGPIYRSGDLLIGGGFVDAYEAAEKRDERSRSICAVQLSQDLLANMPNTRHAWRLVCQFEGHFYIHPHFLTDPAMGGFSAARIVELLERAGVDGVKLAATRRFLDGLEDYDAAMLPGSVTRTALERAGQPWNPDVDEVGSGV